MEDPKAIQNNDEWMTVTCPKAIEYYLKLRNRRHFGQAKTEGTPFTSTAMKEKFNWESTTYQAELVLKGKYKDNEIDSISMMLLKNMKQSLAEEESNKFITEEQF